MKTQLHHAAINVNDIDWYSHFFQTIFHMKVRKTAGEKPFRQIWFQEGIQLNEDMNIAVHDGADGAIDHLSISVENINNYLTKVLHEDCTCIPDKENWFKLPNGLNIELVLSEKI